MTTDVTYEPNMTQTISKNADTELFPWITLNMYIGIAKQSAVSTVKCVHPTFLLLFCFNKTDWELPNYVWLCGF